MMDLYPGGVDQELERLGYKRINRRMFPREKDMGEPKFKDKLIPAADKLEK